ncbi:flagellar biosynthesis anti-sigma factor FlgM [Enterococcus sp. 8G7_MSG3316]|uniref:Negative regulator of flagellin synthesis n=1 Tax=Candidatus Enterococcus testudinis TaxID=1834191 RepID=A0A242A2E6_9ENTE|nr:flagellar biosynthesis anti-sigma factor FlgM [Enterococcus sp. 8G7_MSG3316]OTN75080.1 flagellar biosynthesis anti-sigma factor FlgM [Enterococcus sp. 8G7_MSG3316]
MKIERGYADYADKAIQREAVKQSKPAAAEVKKTVDVQLSETAQAMQKSTSQEASRSTRVAELKQAIKAGTYQVSAETIADKMLAHEKQVD